MQPPASQIAIARGHEHMRPEILNRINTDRRLAKWGRWLWAHIDPEIHSLHVNRAIWLDVQQIVAANPSLPASYWWQFMSDSYGAMLAMALRRQVEVEHGVITLGQLLFEMSETPNHLSRDFYLTRYGTDDTRLPWARRHWIEEFAGDVGDYLDPKIPAADLERMTDAVAGVKTLVDRHLAHRDRKAVPADSIPTLHDAHEAIDVIGSIYRRYRCLMTGVENALLLPPFDHDWQDVFREPWVQPSG